MIGKIKSIYTAFPYLPVLPVDKSTAVVPREAEPSQTGWRDAYTDSTALYGQWLDLMSLARLQVSAQTKKENTLAQSGVNAALHRTAVDGAIANIIKA